MVAKSVAPFGAWPSAVTTTWLTNAAVRLSAAQVEGQRLFWVEGRPWEQGRMVVVGHDQNGTRDWIPAPFGARTRVHEYGGGAFCVHGADLWFCDDASTQIFHTRGDGHCSPVTQPSDWRLADLQYDQRQQRLLAVGENHARAGEPENALVSIDLASGRIDTLATGRDFFGSPRLSADGSKLAYLAWDHPNMPWDAAELWLCDVASDGALTSATHVAGDANASVFGPAWSPAGTLAFAWEAQGYWDIYTWSQPKGVRALTNGQTEFALPQWQFGMSTLSWCNERTLVAAGTALGVWQIYAFDVPEGAKRVLVNDLPALSHLHAQGDGIVAIGSAPDMPNAVVRVSLAGGFTVVKTSLEVTPEISATVAQPISYDFATDDEGVAHALFYPPFSATHEGPALARPPVVVMAHSGPTAQTHPAFNPSIVFWTSRGFAVIDVNYRGSTGYGRAYRQHLRGQWGVVDVADCVAAAQAAAAQGWVDKARMAIRGSSAGGFTALAALAFHKVFGAGATLYGVSDLEALARDTHKFESRYLDGLIGPYPAAASVYRERSPLYAAAAITAPVIFFQGLEDKVVPPSQAQSMYEALLANGITTKYLAFEHEQHGFRRAETVRRVFDEELAFYRKVFAIEAGDNS